MNHRNQDASFPHQKRKFLLAVPNNPKKILSDWPGLDYLSAPGTISVAKKGKALTRKREGGGGVRPWKEPLFLYPVKRYQN